MRIFVTVGTQPHPFMRIFEMIELVAYEANYRMQTGTCDYQNDEYFVKRYINDFETEIKEADVIICHGGVGSILSGLENKKKIIAVPRRKDLEEHVNDHQIEVCQEFTDQGYILMAQTPEELEAALFKIETFEPRAYFSNKNNFVTKLEGIIEELC